MINRKELKENAKKVLKPIYWKSFLVSLILLFATGNFGNYGGSNTNFNNNGNIDNIQNLGKMDGNVWAIIFGTGLFAVIISIVLRIFVKNPLEVGCRKYFIDTGESGTNDLNSISFGFKKENYKNVIKVMFFKNLYVFLWSLLFIIPGIIKSYSYKFVPYLLAENPNMKKNKAISLSKILTDGKKIDMCILDLSFIGWYLLGTLALFIGVLFVYPYYNATYAQLYLRRKKYINSLYLDATRF